MNSAPIIAACAVNARKRKQEHYNTYFDKDFEFYYKVKLRKYYHFEPMTLVKVEDIPHCKPFSKCIPQTEVVIKPVQVEAKSLVVERMFTVYSKNCPNGIDNYIEENLDRYAESGIWYMSDREAVYTYIEELNKKFNIDLDKDSLKYTTQYCWEVESDVR